MKACITLATILLLSLMVVSVPRSFANPGDPVNLVLSISGPATVKSGEAIEIKFVLKNLSSKPFQIRGEMEPEGERHFVIDVHRDDGQPIPKTKYGRALLDDERNEYYDATFSLGVRDIAPNDTFETTSILSNLYDMKAPGNYVIQAKRCVSDSGDVFITSNQLTVKVTR